MKQIDPSAEFPKVEKMLLSLAWKFSNAYGVSFDDARSEAYAGFMKACGNFKPNQGMKFSSWCYLVTWGFLKSWIIRRAKDPLIFVESLHETDLGHAEPEYSGCRTIRGMKALELVEQVSRHQNVPSTFWTLLTESPQELWEATEGLSTEAEELLCLLWEAPGEIATVRGRSQQVARAREHFYEKVGPERGEQAFRELQQRLQAAWA